MSARLIKGGTGAVSQPFAPLPIPAASAGASQPTVSGLLFSMPPPDEIESEEPEAVAEQIIAAARAKAADIEQQAVENGRALMQAEVTAEVASIIGPWQEQLTNTLAELDDLRAGITAQAERDLVRLALEIARKVVHREVSIDKDIVMTLARIGLTRGHSRTPATIHLHPDDFTYVNLHREQLVSGQTLELVEDRSIMRGGCLVRTEMGDVDARIDQQFIEIERAFLEA